MPDELIYLDHAATTPVDPRVREAMHEYFADEFGNPSSVHRFGQRADAAVEASRQRIASILNCSPQEIIFTGCGSESDNLALRGAALAARMKQGKNHLVVSAVEHDAVLRTAEQLRDHYDFKLDIIPVNATGMVQPEQLEKSIRSETAVVSIIYANNEIGTINPIQEIAALCRQRGVLFHTDAVQAASQLPLDVTDLGVDLLSLGAHKFYGPKGVGVLYRRSGVPLEPILTGGGQEHGLRAGTHNVAYIVGMAAALAITEQERDQHNARFARLRDLLLEEIPRRIGGTHLTGHPTQRLSNHASFAFEGVDGNAMLAALDLAGFACSSGSACKTGDPEPSSVLLALGLSSELALGSLRITVGRNTTEVQIEQLLASLPEIVERMRAAQAVPS